MARNRLPKNVLGRRHIRLTNLKNEVVPTYAEFTKKKASRGKAYLYYSGSSKNVLIKADGLTEDQILRLKRKALEKKKKPKRTLVKVRK